MKNKILESMPIPDSPLDILVIAPHPDDAELGMGGSIAKWIREGKNVGVLDLTTGEPTPHGSEEIRKKETAAATQALGIEWRFNLGLRNRFLEPTLDNRHLLASVFRLTRPRWLFAPFWNDAHPDHIAATELVEAARFWSKLSKSDLDGERYHPERIIYYYCIHLRQSLQPNFIVNISDCWDAKKTAIASFHSQFVVGREEMRPSLLEQFETESAFWGKMINRAYGEPFAVKEPIGLENLDALI